jgi:ssDNA-binding Zn-finger/Zn-ribbon topoisomerase 1
MTDMAETSEALEVIQPQSLATWTPRFALTVDEAVELVDQKREFMKRVMRENEHYGVIPGTKGKPSLFKPGAELLLSSMGLHPRYRDTAPAIEDFTGAEHNGEPFFRYRRTCMITRSTGPGPDDYVVIAEASGNCNSWEKKYRYRKADVTCPACGKKTIIRGKAEFGGGWICWKTKGGCGAKFTGIDKRITEQATGDVPNPDIADLVNTLEKMADKRALVAATLLATGCSDIFTQDLEDGGPSVDDERAPAVDQDGVIANPSEESLKAVADGASAPSSSGPPPKPAGRDRSAVETSAPSGGPRAKRGNVVQAPQGAVGGGEAAATANPAVAPQPPETPATTPTGRGGFSYRDHGKEELLSNARPANEPVGPTPLADEIAKMQAKVEELKAKAKERDAASLTGKAEYAAALRQSIRESAAQLRQLRVRMQNADAGAGGPFEPLPDATPSTESDDSLSAFIVDQHAKGKLKFSTLAALEAKDLETVGKTLDDLIARVEAKLK